MQAAHFIDVLHEVYERAWSLMESPLLAPELAPGLADMGIMAAHAVAVNNWHEKGPRAGQVGAALLRRLYGENATAEAIGLSPWLQMSVANTEDPLTREQIAALPPPG